MENNIITLPGNVDVSLVDGAISEFVIHATYDITNSRISNPYLFRNSIFKFVVEEPVEEIINAVKRGDTIKMLCTDPYRILYDTLAIFYDGNTVYTDVVNLSTDIVNYDEETDELEIKSCILYDFDGYEQYYFDLWRDDNSYDMRLCQPNGYGGMTDTIGLGMSNAICDFTDGKIYGVADLADATTYTISLNLTSGNNPQVYATASDVYYAVTRHSDNTSFYLNFSVTPTGYFNLRKGLVVRLSSVNINGSTYTLISEVFFGIDGSIGTEIIIPYIITYVGSIPNDSTQIQFNLHLVDELDGKNIYVSDDRGIISISGTGITGIDYSGDNSYANTVWNVIGGTTEVATPSDINTVTAIAEGKTKAYVTNKTKMSALNSSNDTVTISSFTDLNNTTVALSNFKVGDIVYLTDTEIPDRWVSSINTTTSNNVTTVTGLVLSKMETSKVDLNSYVPTSRTIAGVDLADNITKAELQGATNDSTHRFVTDTEKTTWNNKISSDIIYKSENDYEKVVNIVDSSSDKDTNIYITSNTTGNDNVGGVFIRATGDFADISLDAKGNNDSYIALTTYNGSGSVRSELSLNSNIEFNTAGTGKVRINNNEVITTSKTAASGGTDLSLVTTGDKYNWNNKVSSTTITNIQVVSSMPASPDSNTLYIVQ